MTDNATENLQDAPVYESANHYVSLYDKVIDMLGDGTINVNLDLWQ